MSNFSEDIRSIDEMLTVKNSLLTKDNEKVSRLLNLYNLHIWDKYYFSNKTVPFAQAIEGYILYAFLNDSREFTVIFNSHSRGLFYQVVEDTNIIPLGRDYDKSLNDSLFRSYFNKREDVMSSKSKITGLKKLVKNGSYSNMMDIDENGKISNRTYRLIYWNFPLGHRDMALMKDGNDAPYIMDRSHLIYNPYG